MSESVKSNVQPEVLDITSSPDEAVNAATIELNEQNSIEEEAQSVQTEIVDNHEVVGDDSRPATRQEIIERLKVIAGGNDVLNCKSEVEGLKVQFYRMRTAELELAHKEFLAQGGESDMFMPKPDYLEPPCQQEPATARATTSSSRNLPASPFPELQATRYVLP